MFRSHAQRLKFLPQEGCVFLAGLGNRAITPDALGPRVASKVLATRHLRTALTAEELTYLPELRPVCVLAGGVLGARPAWSRQN